VNVYFSDEKFYELRREDGLFYVTIPAIYEGSPNEGTGIKFILDTGACMTVISRGTAIRRGFDKLPKVPTELFGFGGGISVDFVRIPGLIILGKLHTDIPVLIPHEMYRSNPMTGQKKQMPEVLGLNVLEHFNYYIDTANDRLYLKENPSPRFYSDKLRGGFIYASSDEDSCNS